MDNAKAAIQKTTDPRRFRPVFRRNGERISGVYERDGVFYAYIRDPDTGRRRWVRAPGQTPGDAEAVVKRAAGARDEAERAAFRDAVQAGRRRSEWSSLRRVLAAYPDAAAERFAVARKPRPISSAAAREVALRVIGNRLDEPADRAPAILADYVREHADLAPASIKSAVLRIRMVFTPWALDFYERAGLHVPRALKWPDVFQPVYRYQAPPEALRRATIDAGKREIEARSAIGAAFLCCYFCAMSCADAARARWDWLGADGHVHFRRHKTDRPCDPPLSQWALAQWMAWAAEAKEPTVLQGFASDAARHEFLHREVGPWLRSLGWDAGNGAHELRKLAASLWMSSCGLAYASRWIGDNQATCAKYYADCLPELAPPVPES